MSAELKKTIGRRVQAARGEAELTQEALAAQVGRSTEAISNIERGFSLPTLETLDRIARTLRVPLIFFFDEVATATSSRRSEIDAKVQLLMRSLSDRDAETALGMLEVLRQSRGRSAAHARPAKK